MLDILAAVACCPRENKRRKGISRAGALLLAPSHSSFESAAMQKRAEAAYCFESFPLEGLDLSQFSLPPTQSSLQSQQSPAFLLVCREYKAVLESVFVTLLVNGG